ncbi:MBL fold metallo-hydrolase [Glaciihabitans sp. UYNi722]|uniref:MBL fold metallo-hydrolase n=1 Tax=Glaciihabitans sp. UYNi722 TaxID=3156344 RepID=UPI003391DC9D
MNDTRQSELAGTYTPPIVKGDPVEISTNVYVIPDHRVSLVPNIGIVVGDSASLVIDTGVGRRNGAYVLDQAKRLTGSRPLYLAVTQLDPGHGFGAQSFAGEATIIYSTSQRTRLRENAPSYAEPFIGLGTEVAAEFEGLELVDSTLTYSGSLEIDLGGTRAVLRDWGVSHTADDQTITIDSRVLFGGDLFQTRMFPIIPYVPPFDTHFDGDRWIDALDELVALDIPVVVPGHGEVTDTDQIRGVRDYLDYVRTASRRLRSEGVSLEEAGTRIEEYSMTQWPTWGAPRWVRSLVKAFYTGA